MTDIYMFTASNPDAQRHWQNSIAYPVSRNLVYTNFPQAIHVELDNISQSNDGFYCWGATPGDSNIANWERLGPGDEILGYYKKYYRCVTRVVAKYHNQPFAKALWGTDDSNHTWEYMYFLEKPEFVEVHSDELEDVFGGSPQGFRHVADWRTENIIAKYGSIERFVQQRLSLGSRTIPAPPPTQKTKAQLLEEKLKKIQEKYSLDFDAKDFEDARERTLRAVVNRRGQPEFRKRLLLAYGERCAVTGFDCVSALEAAHIIPYKGEHTNHPSNGLLLRSDIHTLYDCGLIAVNTADYTVLIADELVGSSYEFLSAKTIKKPGISEYRPSKDALDSHRRDVFVD